MTKKEIIRELNWCVNYEIEMMVKSVENSWEEDFNIAKHNIMQTLFIANCLNILKEQEWKNAFEIINQCHYYKWKKDMVE